MSMPAFKPRDKVTDAETRRRRGVVEAVRKHGFDVWWRDSRSVEKSVPAKRLLHIFEASTPAKRQRKDVRLVYRQQTAKRRKGNAAMRSKKTSKAEFEDFFKEEVLPVVVWKFERRDGVPDRPGRREAWNDTIDHFIREGLLPESAGNWSHPRWLETYRPSTPSTDNPRSQLMVPDGSMDNPSRRASEGWEHERHELGLYIDNEFDLYKKRLAIEKNLSRKLDRGTYDAELAPKAWLYLVDEGARKYIKEFGGDIKSMFPKQEVRIPIAEEYARDFEEEAGLSREENHSHDVHALKRRALR